MDIFLSNLIDSSVSEAVFMDCGSEFLQVDSRNEIVNNNNGYIILIGTIRLTTLILVKAIVGDATL